jgi:hypothetical protein
MLELLGLAATGAATFFGYTRSRSFVRRRLAFVEAVQKSGAPLVAGTAAVVVAAPIAWALPIIGTGTALLFGAAVGVGVAAGARDTRHRRLSA